MLIVSTHIPKQYMHKKENMLFLFIPSQSSVLQSHQIQNRNLIRQTSTTTKRKKKKKKSARMMDERLKDRTETVKNDWAPHIDKPLWIITMSRPRCHQLRGWLFCFTSGIVHFHWAPSGCLHLYTSGSTFLKGKARSDLPSVGCDPSGLKDVCPSQEEPSSGPFYESRISSLTKNGWGFASLVVAVPGEVDTLCVKLYSQVVK